MPFDISQIAQQVAGVLGKPDIGSPTGPVTGDISTPGNLNEKQDQAVGGLKDIAYNVLTGSSANNVSNNEFGQALAKQVGVGGSGQETAGNVMAFAPMAVGMVQPQQLEAKIASEFGNVLAKEVRAAPVVAHEINRDINTLAQKMGKVHLTDMLKRGGSEALEAGRKAGEGRTMQRALEALGKNK